MVSCKLLRKDFDGDVTSEFGISGSVDFSHPALADELQDLLMREFEAG